VLSSALIVLLLSSVRIAFCAVLINDSSSVTALINLSAFAFVSAAALSSAAFFSSAVASSLTFASTADNV